MQLLKNRKFDANAKRRHPLQSLYDSMIYRCYNDKCTQFADYGGRGIRVCDKWLPNQPYAQGFWNFVADMDKRPDGTTIDRINNDGGYEPSNCRWATRAEQQRNRKNNVMLTYRGKTQCAKDWAIEIGVADNTILHRIKRGLLIEEILKPKGQ